MFQSYFNMILNAQQITISHSQRVWITDQVPGMNALLEDGFLWKLRQMLVNFYGTALEEARLDHSAVSSLYFAFSLSFFLHPHNFNSCGLFKKKKSFSK